MLQASPATVDTAKAVSRRLGPGWRWIAAGALVAVVFVALVWWLSHRAAPVHYLTMPATRGAISRSVTATGTVNPVLTIVVGSYDSGVIRYLFCDYNTQVRAGQVCAKIDPRPFQAALDQYIGQLMRDQAILAKDRLDLDRYQNLAAQNSIARQQTEDQAYVVKQDEGTVKLDEAYVETAKLNLAYTDIISPVDGTVVSRSVTAGQTVASSFQTPTLFLIATDLKNMEVDTNASEGDIGGIREGDTASFTVDAYPQRAFHGAVTQVRKSPQTVQNVVTYDVVVGVDNSDLALIPGMTASIQIVTEQRNDVLRVANQTLRYVPAFAVAQERATTGQPPRVWVLRDGTPQSVNVSTGLSDDNFTEITSGDLKSGDAVIGSENSASGTSPARPAGP